jgi:thiol-disulfide isomerase/thioredoxin
VDLNQSSPDFELPDLDGRRHRLSDYRGRIAVINFWSCECPHAERTDRDLVAVCMRWPGDVVLLPIAANRIESVQALSAVAPARSMPMVLHDQEHVVADLYDAQTTPHVFVVDRAGILRYRGSVDDVNFGQRTPTRFFLQEAVEALLADRLPAVAETLAYGCAIVREAVE